MAASLQLPGGLRTLNPQPEISRYYNLAGTPYTSTAQVLSEILPEARYKEQTFDVNGDEYWFHNGTLDADLVIKTPDLSGFELLSNKQNNLNYDGTGTKYPTVDGVNNWTRNVAKVATKTGLLSKHDTFNLTVLDINTARILAVESCMFWNEIFVPNTSPSSAIKSFPQKDYPLSQLITATGGNVNTTPLTTDGIYVRYLGYDKNGNVYSDSKSFASNNDIFQIGYVSVLKTGSTVAFLGGTTPGGRNVFAQPSIASNTDFDKIASITTNIQISANATASFRTRTGTIVGISINWKSLSNPINSDPIDVFNYVGQSLPAFASIDPNFLNSTSPITPHTLWTELEAGIAINSSFFNTTTNLRDTMNNGSASVKRILVGLRGGVFVQEAEHSSAACYANLTTAKNNLFNQTFSDAIIPPGVVIEIARIAYVKGATVFTDDTQVYIVNTTSNSGGGSSSIPPVSDATTTTKGILKLAGDLSGTADLPTVPALTTKENLSNKQNSLTVDGSGTKYPTVDAVNAGLAIATDLYTNATPTYTTNLGIPIGTTFSNKTMQQMWDALLYPELFPTLTNPSNTFTTSLSALYEIGTLISSISFNASFNRGGISPAYGTSGFRSGLPTTYVYTGTGLTNTSTTSLTDAKTVLNYTVAQGVASWTGTVTYSVGEQPLSNKGNPFSTPLAAGTLSPVITRSTEGVFPLFGTTSTITTLTKQSLVSMISANNVQMTLVAETGGNKQKFEIPVAWTTSRPLAGILQLNTVSNQYEYPGGSQATSLAIWTTSATTETIQSSTINYTRYTFNGSDRGSVTIRLVF